MFDEEKYNQRNKEVDEYIAKEFPHHFPDSPHSITKPSITIDEIKSPTIDEDDAESSLTDKLPDISLESESYAFPLSEEHMARIKELVFTYDPKDASENIERLSYMKDDSSPDLIGYNIVRHHLITDNLVLNLQGSIAPRFRSMRTPPNPTKKPKYSLNDRDLSNDRQVIDLHWIHCQKMVTSDVKGFKKLFDNTKPFDWDNASRFVSLIGSTAKKAGLIGLSEFDELQLCSIVSQQSKTRMKTIENSIERDTRKLRDYISKAKCKLQDHIKKDFINIHKALLISRQQPLFASKAYSFITGNNMSVKQMQRYKDTIQVALK